MGSEDEGPKHDIENLWSNQRATDQRLSSLEATVGAMADDVRRGNDMTAKLLTKPHESFDWKGVIIIALAVAGMAGGLVAATIAPISATVRKHDTQLVTELVASAEHRYKAGVRDGKLESMETVVGAFIETTHDRLIDLEGCASSASAKQEIIIDWITAVDHLGSRKHVISAPQALRQAESEIHQGATQ